VKLQKLLVPVDFSLGSETAFKYAKFLAKKFSGRIHLIHVVDKRYVEKIAELNGESGTGHGSSFVKRAVEIHEGVVGYEPTPLGNNFCFILPTEESLSLL
jgi:nucleotide-binding universal stress UspA family protein